MNSDVNEYLQTYGLRYQGIKVLEFWGRVNFNLMFHACIWAGVEHSSIFFNYEYQTPKNKYGVAETFRFPGRWFNLVD